MVYSNNFNQVRIGVRNVVVTQVVNAVDADATAFIAAAGITDLTQAAAINTLVDDLKTYGIWSKMKALYPFVGGSATSHKFNLKDPRDLDAAFRLVFNGGWSHASTGAKPNGTNGYADSKFIISQLYSNITNIHISYYSRTNTNKYEMIGMQDDNVGQGSQVYVQDNGAIQYYSALNIDANSITVNKVQSSIGHYLTSRTSLTLLKGYKNGVVQGSNTNTSSGLKSTLPIIIGGAVFKFNSTSYYYGDKESAFASIGDGLTDGESANFYTAVQKFQTTLGRQVGTPAVSDSDAQAFLNAAGITDLTQTSAINTLVTDLKTAGVWTKMKALYPFVGGSATSHKWNLKDPRDLDAAYRLVFNGGWTHTSNGALSNGTTGYADTKLAPNIMGLNSQHMSFYVSIEGNTQMGVAVNGYNFIDTFDSSTFRSPINLQNYSLVSATINNRKGFFLGNRNSSTNTSIYKNSSKLNDNFLGSQYLETYPIYISGLNRNPTTNISPSNQYIFASIGDGLTDTEASIFYTALQRYQTTLGRQLNIPVVSDGDAQSFLTAAGITSYTQANAVNTLVVDLKAAAVWTKMKALYPFVGGTATSHKFNLKDPRDVDAAFRLVFNGGGAHSSNGYQLNGTNAYANTFFVPNNSFISQNRSSFGVYSRTDSNLSGKIIMGSHGGNGYIYMYLKDGTGQYALNNTNWSSFGGPVSTYVSKKGFFQASRNNSSTTQLWQVDNLNYSSTSNSTGRSTISITIGDCNGLLGGYAENVQVSFSYIGDDLSTTDLSNYYTAVQKFQTSLGRAVNTPVYNNGLVLNLDAGNANSYPGTGTTWFDLAAGNNGTLVNGPTYDINNGGSLSFDGVNDYVVVSDTPFRFGNQFTINTWIYWDGLDKTNRAILGKRNGPSGNYNQYAMGINNGDVQYGGTGKVLFFYARVDGSTGGNDPLDVSMTYTLPSTPGIYNISVVMNSTIQKMFVNGLLVSTSTKNVSGRTYNISGVDLLVGASRDNTGTGALGFFNNKIYSVSVYGRTLTDTEVLQNFNSTRGRFGL